MLLDDSKVKKILVVSLTNIGDVVLTFPVIDVLANDFPSACISVVVGPKAESLFSGNAAFDKVFVYDKHQRNLSKLRWISTLRKEKFDLVVDLRNSAIPLFLNPRFRTSMFRKGRWKGHMRDKHLSALSTISSFETKERRKFCIDELAKDQQFANDILREHGIMGAFAIMCPGAADHRKRWPAKYFAQLADRIIDEHGISIVFAGSAQEEMVTKYASTAMKNDSVCFAGDLDLSQLAMLMKRARFIIGNDSGPMHLASYLDVPSVVLFGPSDPVKYGPWGLGGHFLSGDESCHACKNKKIKAEHVCMKNIVPNVVMNVLINEKEFKL